LESSVGELDFQITALKENMKLIARAVSVGLEIDEMTRTDI